MSPHGLADGLAGNLQLVDVEDADTEVTVSRALLSRCKQNPQACCQALRRYRTRRGIDYLFTAATALFEQLVLN